MRSIKDERQILGPFFPGRNRATGESVRSSYTSPIEHDQPTERREALKKAGTRRILPAHIDVADLASHVDEIQRAVTDDLVRDL